MSDFTLHHTSSLIESNLAEGFYADRQELLSSVFFQLGFLLCVRFHIFGGMVCVCVCAHGCMSLCPAEEEMVGLGLGSIFSYDMAFNV